VDVFFFLLVVFVVLALSVSVAVSVLLLLLSLLVDDEGPSGIMSFLGCLLVFRLLGDGGSV